MADPITSEHDAALDALAEYAHEAELDELVDRSHAHRAPAPEPDDGADEVRQPSGGLAVLRKGVRVMPEIREGIVVSLLFAVAVAAGKLLIPVAIQQVLDKGVLGTDGFDGAFVARACAAAAVGVIVLMVLSRITYLRLVRAAEGALYSLRVRVFEHIHRLSVAEQNETKRGVLVARVTSDIETLARFVNWGAISWVVNSCARRRNAGRHVDLLVAAHVDHDRRVPAGDPDPALPATPTADRLRQGPHLHRRHARRVLRDDHRRGRRARVRPRGPFPRPHPRTRAEPLPRAPRGRALLRVDVPGRRLLRVGRRSPRSSRSRRSRASSSGSISGRSSRSHSS